MEFDNDKVKKQIDSALKIVKNVLVNSKKPKDASTVFHQYSDKFDLVDLLVLIHYFISLPPPEEFFHLIFK